MIYNPSLDAAVAAVEEARRQAAPVEPVITLAEALAPYRSAASLAQTPDDDEDVPECEGHESLRGDSMGVSVFCPNDECVR